ncbi:hypothetical protein J5N97_022434 [Dioscorea zingiberensis]|uniref:Glyoxal oxidase N-terminal domain-containing protein n=1 Tax=Dioscorea zingiberensis TaxID=325984 RepID=A0A9D5HAU0_9LILI|nr:hypothetical protein J5N97_022434 [Dioscorea zingiberensis]
MGISVMHMQLLPDDKLLAFNCTDFGPSNISLPDGHCRLDPSDLALTTDCTSHSVLLDLPTLLLRPLTILTDTWCSSGPLPNASFFKFGEFNGGDHTIRLFASITPTSDWTETSGYLSARRWYATNQLLPDGQKPNRCSCKLFSKFSLYPEIIKAPPSSKVALHEVHKELSSLASKLVALVRRRPCDCKDETE